ncbi:MAG: hypothetical protein DRJ03_15545 [Chloroflexi bacterium]|nr:MAG: hypothetical protein DRJ03_15545 [Chloroflexota bacterium]
MRQASAKKQLFGKTQNPALAVSRKMKNAIGVLGAAKKQLFGKTQNPALAVSRKMKDAVGVLGAAKKQLFGKTQNPALAVSRKMKDTVGVLGASKRKAMFLADPTPEGKALRNRLSRSKMLRQQDLGGLSRAPLPVKTGAI